MDKGKSINELLEFGILNVDKPTGPTSFQVGQFVKESLGLRKTSHLGTLDPAVTGVLPIALNRACKLNEFLIHRNKEYVGIMRLHENISDELLEKEVKKFVGKILQLPPVRSNVKRAERIREIKSFDMLERDEKDVLFQTCVQAGTYIRKLIHDLGEKIGGAHMLELRRIKAGAFDENKIYDLYEFEAAVKKWKKGDDSALKEMIVPAEECLREIMPSVQLKPGSLKQILTGKPLMKSDVGENVETDEFGNFAVFLGKRFIAVMKSVDEKDIIGRSEFVLN